MLLQLLLLQLLQLQLLLLQLLLLQLLLLQLLLGEQRKLTLLLQGVVGGHSGAWNFGRLVPAHSDSYRDDIFFKRCASTRRIFL